MITSFVDKRVLYGHCLGAHDELLPEPGTLFLLFFFSSFYNHLLVFFFFSNKNIAVRGTEFFETGFCHTSGDFERSKNGEVITAEFRIGSTWDVPGIDDRVAPRSLSSRASSSPDFQSPPETPFGLLGCPGRHVVRLFRGFK